MSVFSALSKQGPAVLYGACVTSYGVVDSISELLNVWPEERPLRPLKVKNSTRCGSFHVSERPT